MQLYLAYFQSAAQEPNVLSLTIQGKMKREKKIGNWSFFPPKYTLCIKYLMILIDL